MLEWEEEKEGWSAFLQNKLLRKVRVSDCDDHDNNNNFYDDDDNSYDDDYGFYDDDDNEGQSTLLPYKLFSKANLGCFPFLKLQLFKKQLIICATWRSAPTSTFYIFNQPHRLSESTDPDFILADNPSGLLDFVSCALGCVTHA